MPYGGALLNKALVHFADFISIHSYFLNKNEQTPTEIVNSYKLSEELQEIGFGASLYFSIKDYWREENGDFGLFSNNDPDLPNSDPYPAFYHFYYMDRVLGDEMVQAEVLPSDDSLICFASSYQYGGTGMIIINTSVSVQTLDININNFPKGDKYYWYEVSIPVNDDLWSQKVEINGISNPSIFKIYKKRNQVNNQ